MDFIAAHLNAVVAAVVIMLALSLARVHVVLSLTVGAFAGGLLAGMPLADTADAAGNVSRQGIITVFKMACRAGRRSRSPMPCWARLPWRLPIPACRSSLPARWCAG